MKSPEEATVEVEIYFEGLMAKHRKFRLDCDMSKQLSLDPAHDKLLAVSRTASSAADDVEEIKLKQEAMLDQFDRLDDRMGQ